MHATHIWPQDGPRRSKHVALTNKNFVMLTVTIYVVTITYLLT
jgi:hypothetical protein